MRPAAISRRYVKYETWYEFKKDLEANLGCHLVNELWLQLKPKAPLPWDDSNMRLALLLALRKV